MDDLFNRAEDSNRPIAERVLNSILKDGYEIKSPDGAVTCFHYDKTTDSWSQVQNGKTTEIFRFNADGTIKVNVNGKTLDVTTDQCGLNQVADAAGYGWFYASR